MANSSEKVSFRVDMQCSSLRAEAFLVFDKGSQPTLGQQITDMRPTVGRQTANSRPTNGQQSADYRQKIFVEGGKRQLANCWSTVDRLSVDCHPTVGQLLADCWPTVGRQFFGGAVLHFFHKLSENHLTSIIIIYIIMTLFIMVHNICLQLEICMCSFVLHKRPSVEMLCQHTEELYHLNYP